MKQSQRVVKNVLAGGLSTALGGLLQLGAVLYVARHVAVADFGIYSFMLAFAFILQRFADFGISSILIRDFAIEPDRIGDVLGSSLLLAWVATVGLAALMYGAIPLLPFNHAIALMTVTMGVAGLTQIQCGFHVSALRSQEDNELQGLSFILHKVVLLTLTVGLLTWRPTLWSTVFAQLSANLFQWWLCRFMVIKRYAYPRFRVDLKLWKYLLVESIPVGAAGVVRLLSEQADILILIMLTTPKVVGLFAGSYRLSAGLRFLPQAMVLAVFPIYSRAAAAAGSREDFQDAYERGVRGFLLIAIPVALLFLCLPGPITVGLLGNRYLASIPATRLMGIGVFLLFLASPFPFLLTAINDQRFLFVSCVIALVTRASLDLALAHTFLYLAPCIALAVAESLLVGMWIWRLWQLGHPLRLLDSAWRMAIAAVLMAVVLLALNHHSLLFLAPVAAVATLGYLAVAIRLGAISVDDIDLAREGIKFIKPMIDEWSRSSSERRAS